MGHIDQYERPEFYVCDSDGWVSGYNVAYIKTHRVLFAEYLEQVYISSYTRNNNFGNSGLTRWWVKQARIWHNVVKYWSSKIA